MSRRYGRMPESGSSEGRPADSDADAAKRRRSELLDRLVGKVQAAFWVALAGVVLHYGDILRTAVDPSKSNELFMGIGAAASLIVFGIFLYLAIYLRYIAGIRLEWSVYAPNAIPAATVAGLIAFLSFIIGLWPTFRLLTPLVVFVLFMGLVFSTAFIPIP